MLEAMRKRSKSVVAYALFGLLILSFGLWGIGDYIGGGPSGEAVAVVGELEIGPQQYYRAYRNEIDRMRGLLGGVLDHEQAKALGIHRAVLQRLVSTALLAQAGRDLGLSVSDDLIREDIRSRPVFADPAGRFDRNRFVQVLQSNGMTEGMLVEQIRTDLERTLLLGSFDGMAVAPKALIEPLFGLREERRIAETIRIPDEVVAEVGTPTDADLAAFHQENAPRFTAPEYRRLTYLTLKAADLTDEVQVPPERISDLYLERADSFNVPERRRLSQIVLPSEDEARTLVTNGGPWENPVDLGTKARDELPLPAIADLAFGLSAGQIGGPVQSPFGWHVVRVEAIEPPRTKPLAEAQAELYREIALELAIDVLYDLANRVEDSLGGGATLEEAGAANGVSVATIEAVDANGRGPHGRSLTGLAADPGFLRTAFEVTEGHESALTEFGTDGYYILRVDKVTPPALRPLDTVRDAVRAGWIAGKRATAAADKAHALAERIRGGMSLGEAARSVGAEVKRSDPFTRSGDGTPLPKALVDALFSAHPGETVSAAGPGGAYAARLEEIRKADPNAADQAAKLGGIGGEVARQMSQDMMDQLVNALQGAYRVRINERAVDEVL